MYTLHVWSVHNLWNESGKRRGWQRLRQDVSDVLRGRKALRCNHAFLRQLTRVMVGDFDVLV